MKKLIHVSVGIPAYNEAANIDNIIVSLLAQKQKSFELTEIAVISDASTDKTNETVEKFSRKYKFIKLLKRTSRKGKYFRVNELFRRCVADVLVVLDADIALKGDDFLEKLVTELVADKKAVMMSSGIELVQPSGLIAKVIHASMVLGDMMRLSVPGYDIAPNFHGAATAYKGTFVRTLRIPENLTDPHLYIYLAAKKQNGFRYCPKAIILQHPPMTIHDVKQLMTRTIGKEDPVLVGMFGKDLIRQVHVIPLSAKLLGVWKSLLRQPFYTLLALPVTFYLGRISHPKQIDTSPVWEINTSTKKPIRYAR